MPLSIGDRLRHAWNAFSNKDPTVMRIDAGPSSSQRPDRMRFTRGKDRSIITCVFNRIATDCSQIAIQHVRLDSNGRFIETMDSGLNYCLTTEANIDQTGRALVQDMVMSLLDEGSIAIVPVDTTVDPNATGSYEINSIRVGKITQWFPKSVEVYLYNEEKGYKEYVRLPKSVVSIVENPFFAIMNEQNSILQRLIKKLNLLDAIDEQSGAGKLDLIIQLPYVVKSDARKAQAEQRRKDIETQLAGSKYGIAYTDGTEHITQLNRSVDNQLMSQIDYLTSMLYSQLGITKEILEGTADSATMLNYMNRTIEPILSAITNEMNRKFLTKTARTQKQSIKFFNEPFRLVPVEQLAEIADKFTRNEIMSSNEVRQIIGMKPVNDARADELRNKNLNSTEGQDFPMTEEGMPEEMMDPQYYDEYGDFQNGS